MVLHNPGLDLRQDFPEIRRMSAPLQIDRNPLPSLTINGEEVRIEPRINRRAKRLIIKVDPLSRTVHLTCPTKKSLKDGLAFVQERELWIAARLIEGPAKVPFTPGTKVPFKGQELTLMHAPEQRRAVTFDETAWELHVGGQPEHFARRTEDWLRKEARQLFSNLADQYCQKLAVQRKRITIRDTKSRWGSCSSDGHISLNWRLILSPPYVYNYVVAHEVSHLRYMDHSPKFWKTVDLLIDDRDEAQDWMKKHGRSLYGYGGKD